ncbi:MAG: response regulator [Reichenbachiella sp.]
MNRHLHLLIIGTLCAILNFCSLNISASDLTPVVEKGVIDLRDWEFRTDGPVELNGEWEFYWDRLIFPEEFHSSRIEPIFRSYPKLWKGDTINGEHITSKGYATHRMRVILNSVNTELSIAVPQLYSAYILFINGEYISSNGQVGVSLETSNPHWKLVTRDLKVTSDTLEIVLQISNFEHSKGGARIPLKLGEKVTMQTIKRRGEANDLIMSASLFFVGVFFMVLFWFGRHEKSIFYYALFCLFYSYRAIGSGNYIFHSLFPDLPWILTLKLEYITMFLSALFFALYSYHLYKEETSKYYVYLASVFCLGSVLSALFLPVDIFTRLVIPFSLFVAISAVYLFLTYVVAASRNKEGSRLSLVSSSFLFAVIGAVILEYFGKIEVPILFYFFGYQQFFFIQSIILFYRYNRKIELAKETAEAAARSQSDFLSMISHEIRTPLNAVIGLTNYLISDEPKKDHVDDLKTLKFSAEHLHVLINDVLDYSKLDAGKIEFEYIDTDIIEVCSNIVKGQEPKAREKGVYLNFLHDEEIPKFIVCDSLRMSQILTNLVGNAIKFTNKGGVTLSLSKVMLTKKRVSIKFIVEDSGIGIPKNKQSTIFESFSQASTSTTREFGGTGLGLSITKRILDLQNTKINVFSIEGQGSRFYFTQTFQISDKQERVIETISNQTSHELSGKRILLVEDNPINVMVAKKFLSRWKIEVEVAENGQEGVEQIANNDYDLVLMDLQMPIMDGYSAAKMMRQNGVKAPILALTASVMLDVGDKVYKCGMNDFITKPFDPNDLYNKIRIHIEESEKSKK